MNKRLKEILERKQEIRTSLESDEQIDLDALQEELRNLDDEQKTIEERQRIAEGIATGEIEGRQVENPLSGGTGSKVQVRDMKWNEAIDTQEYRSAWAKDMMGVKMKDEERNIFDKVNEEYREFTHNTENTSVLIPKSVADGIWTRTEEVSSLWADVRKLRVRGDLSMIKSNGNSADARWYDEDEIVDTDQLGFGELNLTGCELAKAVQTTWKLRKMAVPEFEAYIQREIGDRMGAALSKGVYEGAGKPSASDTFKPEPLGISTVLTGEEGTPQIVTYDGTDGLAYTNMTAAMAVLHSSYANGAAIYANNTTIWNVLANLVDGMGRPLFISDVMAGGVGRMFGRSVKADPAIPEGEILIGNLNAGYLANINEDITMYREEHVRQRLTDYMGYAIVDGGPLDNKAFVILRAGAEAPTV